jgi:predicted CXXCH cytochrome family protein
MSALLIGAALAGCERPPQAPGSTGAADTEPPAPIEAVEPGFVGSATCGECHVDEHAAWSESHHALAMQPATGISMLGAFDGQVLRHGPEQVRPIHDASGFAFEVRTGAAAPSTLRVTHAFGVAPLQQYLVDLGRGRLQAFTWAWDSRPAPTGQRWYFLYPQDSGEMGSRLHWSGVAQNWNHQCADCHVTAFSKGYDPAVDAFDTRYSEVGVGCEACHGPGLAHVAWARLPEATRAATPEPPMPIDTRDAVGGAFAFADGDPIARRTIGAHGASDDIDRCGACHARRSPLIEGPTLGIALHDAYRVATLDPGLYFANGLMDDEVFNVGSFLQSRMHEAGVGCGDCHEPHGGRLRAEGNAVCARCHLPDTFDVPAHRGHADVPAATACTTCHMPTRTYMVIDARHDHAFVRPDPEEATRVGAPDPCIGCHVERTPAVLAAAIDGWRRPGARARRSFADALHAGRTWTVDAGDRLRAIVDDSDQAAIVRASAWQLLAPRIAAADAGRLRAAAVDADPLVRSAIAPTLAAWPDPEGAEGLARLLDDPVRSVRFAATAVIVARPDLARDPRLVAHWPAALGAYRASLALDQDRPEALAALAALDARGGDLAGAEALLRRALDMDPRATSASVNLGEVLRARGDAAGALALLRAAVARNPDQPELQHALGLAEVRAGEPERALAALAAAERLAPGQPRLAYVHALAVHDLHDADRGLAALEAAHRRFPGYLPLIHALERLARQRGDAVAEARWREARALVR